MGQTITLELLMKGNTMDAMDILGSLLGGGSSQGSGGLGGKILKDLIGGGRSAAPPPARQAPPASSRAPSGRPASLDDRAHELEDLLGVAHGRATRQASPQAAPPQVAPPQSQTRYQQPPPPSRPRYQEPNFTPQASPYPQSSPGVQNGPTGAMTQNDEALVLVRAMINAAKADGSISQEEQQAIIERIASPTQDTINFLRQEFSSPLNVRDFAWAVPLGMEQQVYTISLASIQLDTNPEASYLRDLAHGLRLAPEFCNEIHQRYGAPTIF